MTQTHSQACCFHISLYVRRDGLSFNWGIACQPSHYTGDLRMISGSRQRHHSPWWMASQQQDEHVTLWTTWNMSSPAQIDKLLFKFLVRNKRRSTQRSTKHMHTCRGSRIRIIILSSMLQIIFTWGNTALKYSKRLWSTNKALPVSKLKKPKAALPTEPHCVTALKGL